MCSVLMTRAMPFESLSECLALFDSSSAKGMESAHFLDGKVEVRFASLEQANSFCDLATLQQNRRKVNFTVSRNRKRSLSPRRQRQPSPKRRRRSLPRAREEDPPADYLPQSPSLSIEVPASPTFAPDSPQPQLSYPEVYDSLPERLKTSTCLAPAQLNKRPETANLPQIAPRKRSKLRKN